ncbi:MAG: DUF2007 domain-containing protein [Bacteroidales bacterium]|nr:DUF2007 domain-containing protein [Bacteroidales bacterium]
MKENDNFIKVYSGTESLVHILQNKLEQNGIPVTIQNDSGDSFLRGTPVALDLYIRQLDVKKAEPIIQGFIKKTNSSNNIIGLDY